MNQESLPLGTDFLAPKLKKPRKPRDPNKPRKLSVNQQIIIKHVSDMEHCHNPADWGREGKICSSLIAKYGSDFLLWVSPLEGYKILSLTFYYSVLGKNYLSDQLLQYTKQKTVPRSETKEISMSQTKIGEDIKTEFKPKTLKEFLKYGKEIDAARRSS